MKRVFFISTNDMWSGSEELWTRSANMLSESGLEVYFSAPFEHPQLNTLKATRLPTYRQPVHLRYYNRLAIRLRIKTLPPPPPPLLTEQMSQIKPDLVVISQGNNIGSLGVMQLCKESAVPYITVSQLVAIVHVFAISENNLKAFQEAYLGAVKNFFISTNNLELNNRMLGLKLANAERVFNPCKLRGGAPPTYPTSTTYQIALVGRVECYHKGLDLLLSVVGQPKWQNRSVSFNLYGNGPHVALLQSRIESEHISNVVFKNHVSKVEDIWKENHLLLMTSRIEGQALSLIEAMWCERAAVVTDVGGASELIEDGKNGFVASVATVNSLDDALERAWERRDEWEQLGKQAAKTLAEKHPKDEVVYFVDKIKENL